MVRPLKSKKLYSKNLSKGKCVEDVVHKETGLRPGSVIVYKGMTFKVSNFDVNLKSRKIYVWGYKRLNDGSFALNDVAIARIRDIMEGILQ